MTVPHSWIFPPCSLSTHKRLASSPHTNDCSIEEAVAPCRCKASHLSRKRPSACVSLINPLRARAHRGAAVRWATTFFFSRLWLPKRGRGSASRWMHATQEKHTDPRPRLKGISREGLKFLILIYFNRQKLKVIHAQVFCKYFTNGLVGAWSSPNPNGWRFNPQPLWPCRSVLEQPGCSWCCVGKWQARRMKVSPSRAHRPSMMHLAVQAHAKETSTSETRYAAITHVKLTPSLSVFWLHKPK